MSYDILKELEEVIEDRRENPKKNSYVSDIIKDKDKVLEKIGEESTEVILATKNNEDIVHEIADLIFHLLVLSAHLEIPFEDIMNELKKRRN